MADALIKVFHFFLVQEGSPQKWIYHFNIQLKCTSYSTWICRKKTGQPQNVPRNIWCLIDHQVTPPLSPHGHELRALQQLWEQKEVDSQCFFYLGADLIFWCFCFFLSQVVFFFLFLSVKDLIFWCFSG